MLNTKVVILNWNGEEWLTRFLPRVVATLPDWASLVVADNGSEDSSEKVVSRFDGIEWLPLGKNYGFAEGYNRALADMEGDVFVLLNSDVEPTEGWLTPLVERLMESDKIAAVQPKILSYSEPTKFEYAGAAGGYIDRYGYPFCRGRIMGTTEQDMGQYDTSIPIFWASGACMAVRAEAWRKAGGLDGDFFAHMEEIDLCWRLQLLGYKIFAEPHSVVYHVGGGTLPNNSPRKIYLNFRNSLCMMHKCLPDGERWRLRARMWMDRLSWVVYALTGKWKFAREVYRAHRDYKRMRPNLDQQRTIISKTSSTSTIDTIYPKWVIWQHIIYRKKGEELYGFLYKTSSITNQP